MVEPPILRALCAELDPVCVHTDAKTLAFMAQDAMNPARLPVSGAARQPCCVVTPRTTAEVVTVVRLANTHCTPIIPMGGGSGLMGGAASVVPGVVVDMRGLQEIVVRAADRMVDAGAGLTINAVNQAAAVHGLRCAHDPWTVAVATVGGTIATNSLGYVGGKYGAMGDQVLGLEVVLPTGEVIVVRGVEKASTGPSLQRLFIGAEGCFGLITRATLRLLPLPQACLLEGWEFGDFAAGFAAIHALLQSGLRPALLEYNDEAPSPSHNPPATLFVSYEGPLRVAQAEAEEGAAICHQHHGRLLASRHVESFWSQRHDIGDAYAASRLAGTSWQRRRPLLDYLHVALPPSAVLSYRRQSLALLAQYGLQIHQTGLWGHAGLFSLVYSGMDISTQTEVHTALLQRCQELQGAMEYCHGVGTRLAPLMAREHGVGLGVLQRLKHSLDPQGIMNPGKLVPLGEYA